MWRGGVGRGGRTVGDYHGGAEGDGFVDDGAGDVYREEDCVRFGGGFVGSVGGFEKYLGAVSRGLGGGLEGGGGTAGVVPGFVGEGLWVAVGVREALYEAVRGITASGRH